MVTKVSYNQAKNNISPRNNFAISPRETKPPRRISEIIYSEIPDLRFHLPLQT
jgi:hypothetical protein